jgi:hypothetical protein
MKGIAEKVSKAYRILLRLYPFRFQEEYGEEMLGIFRQLCRDGEKISGWSVGKLVLREVWDLPRNLLREYLSET